MSVSIFELTRSGFGNLILYGLGEPSGFVEADLVEPISFFPQTLGWLLLAIIVFIYLIYRSLKAFKHWLHNRYRLALIARFPNLQVMEFEYELYRLMAEARAIANRANPDYQAELFGVAWLIDMDAQCVSASTLHSELGRQWMQVLTFERRKPLTVDERQQLLTCCKNWLLQHRNAEQITLLTKRGGAHGV